MQQQRRRNPLKVLQRIEEQRRTTNELSLSYSQWDHLDSKNPLFCRLEVRMWYVYYQKTDFQECTTKTSQKMCLPYFMEPPAPQ